MTGPATPSGRPACPRCGLVVERGDRTCARCGADLASARPPTREELLARMPPAARAEIEAKERENSARLAAREVALKARLWKDMGIGAALFGAMPLLCCTAVAGWGGLVVAALSCGWGAAAGAWLNRQGGGSIHGTLAYGACALGDIVTLLVILGNPLRYGYAAAAILTAFVFRLACGLVAGRWLGMMRTFERMDGVA